MADAPEALRAVAVQRGKTQALVQSFDAAPRHRRLPSRGTVMEWLDRHSPPPVQIIDDPVGRPPLGGDALQRMFDEMYTDAARRYRTDPGSFEREYLGRWAEHTFDQPVEVAPGVEYTAVYPADGTPLDVERDQATGYGSMWPGGIGG